MKPSSFIILPALLISYIDFGQWLLTDNSSAKPGTYFLGTTDSQSLRALKKIVPALVN